MASLRVSRRARGRLPSFFTSIAALVLVGALAGIAVSKLRPRTLRERVAALEPGRAILPQTSVAVKYRRCLLASAEGGVCQGPAEKPDAREIEDLSADIALRLEENPDDPDAMIASARLALLRVDSAHADIDRAIMLLDSALPLVHGDSAEVLTDLAAAHLVRAGERDSTLDAWIAMNYLMQALKLRPGYPPALFDLALVKDRSALPMSLADAWRQYLEAASPSWIASLVGVDEDLEWRNEAARQLEDAKRAMPPVRPQDTTAAGLARFAAENPQAARELGWDEFLPAWAAAVLGGDTVRGRDPLRIAAGLGAALAQQGGDETLAAAVDAIRREAAAGRDLRGRARVHDLYGRYRAARKASSERASPLLDSLSKEPLDAPQRIWVLTLRAAADLDEGRPEGARRLADSLVAFVRAQGIVTVAVARVETMRGTLQARSDSLEDAPRTYLWADSVFNHLGEERNRAVVLNYIADVERVAGNLSVADARQLEAGRILRRYGPSGALHDMLRQAAISAQHERLFEAMTILAQEDIRVSMATGLAVNVVEARINFATLLAASGSTDEAMREMARAWAARGKEVSGADSVFFATADAYVRGLAALPTSPRAANPWADLLIHDSTRIVWPMRGYTIRARAMVTTGDTTGARVALDSVFALLGRIRERSGGAAERSQVEGDVRQAVVQLIQTLVRGGRARDALGWLERATAATSSVFLEDVRLPGRVPDGRAVVRYLVTDDSLLTWVLAGSRISFIPTPVDPAQLRTAIGMMITQLGDHGRADAQRRKLYGWLIAPIASQLRAADDVVFVVDGELAGVPFAAVIEGGDRAFFEAHPVSLALSVRAAADSSVALAGPPGFLAPMYDPRVAPGVPPLPRAMQEVDSAVAIFPGGRVLGAGVGPRLLMDSLPRYGMFHFAGHAVLNVLDPERSYLALGQGRREEQLTAAEIEGLDLKGVRLVVLSACASMGGSGSPSGITGLSGAFLGAGAHGVVGSLWRVNDEVTLALMASFHRYLRTGLTPERALHRAQIEMLGRDGDRFRSPAAWGAFQYVHQ